MWEPKRIARHLPRSRGEIVRKDYTVVKGGFSEMDVGDRPARRRYSLKMQPFSERQKARAICDARAFYVNEPERLRELPQKIRCRYDKDALITLQP